MAATGNIKLLMAELFNDGLYYLQSPRDRPCLMSLATILRLAADAPVTSDAVMCFNNQPLAVRIGKWMEEGTPDKFWVRFIPVAEIQPTLRRWQINGWLYLCFPGEGMRTLAYLSVEEVLAQMESPL
jgi:hypothetical protein